MIDRLWITGVGLTTALGVGVDATWQRLVRGDRAILPVTLFDATDQRVNLAAEVRQVPASRATVGEAFVARTGAMAVAAAREALSMAGLAPAGARVGLVVGCTTGGLYETELLLAKLHVHHDSTAAIEGLAAYPLSGTAAAVDRAAGPFARVRTVSSACSSGANAIVLAASWLLTGDLDAVVAGGSDSLCRLTLGGFNALMALDPEPCRPFDRRRQGTSLGEGAGFVVVERRRDAVARGARAVAELSGWASGADAYHVTNPEPSGRAIGALIEAAMARGGIEPSDLDYVNAHGTGTRANDSAEAAALGRVLGREIERVPVSSCKGQLGHTLGAAGAIEAAVTALVVARGVLVPTGGLEEPDVDLGLTHVPRVGRRVERVRAAISNAFGFGGMNAVLAFRPADDRGGQAPARIPRRAVIVGGGAAGGEGAEAAPELDAARSRRFDDSARRATSATLRALQGTTEDAASCGAILGTAFGTVDGTAAYMHRLGVKGPRFASPADFPNLLPSTSVGHVSIYCGLTGPLFALVDPWVSGESAILDAIGLVAAGVAARMIAGSSEPRGGPVVEALARSIERGAALPDAGASSVLLIEDEEKAASRGARVVARVERVLEWRGASLDGLALLPAPATARPVVFACRHDARADRALAESPWAGCQRWAGDGRSSPVGFGAFAFVAAAAQIARGMATEALVWGASAGGGFAVVLAGSGEVRP